jgi:hypothetical protein
MLEYYRFCEKAASKHGHKCTRIKNHKGRCSHTAVSRVVEKFIDSKAGKKLKCDSYMTPGDKGAVKNRADRCYSVRLIKTEIMELNRLGKKGVGIRKRFSSTPVDCFKINVSLASQIVSISGQPRKTPDSEDKDILDCLRAAADLNHPGGVRCRICLEPIKLENFHTAPNSSDGKSVQLGHIDPMTTADESSAHVAGNVNWIHRDCNIMQGEKSEEDTLDWMARILKNHGRI